MIGSENTVEILAIVELNTATIELRSDGIIQFSVKANSSLAASDARKMVEAAGKLGGGKKYPILIIAGKYAMADKETREFAASEAGNKHTIAGAFVIRSLAQRILGNAYIKVNKPTTPTALFFEEQDAVKWLKTFL
jgi:hypothetical protein